MTNITAIKYLQLCNKNIPIQIYNKGHQYDGDCCINSISYQFYSKFPHGKGDFNLEFEVEHVKDLLSLPSVPDSDKVKPGHLRWM